MKHTKLVRMLKRPSASAKTVDELLKRVVFVYCPVFLFFCFIFTSKITTNTPFNSATDSNESTIIDQVSNESEDIKAHARNKADLKSHKLSDNIQKKDLSGTNDDCQTDRASRHGGQSESNGKEVARLDFLLAGFPKVGTTSLLHLFDKHEETSVAPDEICQFTSDAEISKLTKVIANLPVTSSSMKRGIKCPTSVENSKGLARLVSMNPNLKIVVGLRHPLSWFQSYYNYRITEMYDKKTFVKPPAPTSLIDSKSWRGVSVEGARFELGLMQLGLVELESKDLIKLGKSNKRVFPSSLEVFIYTIDQLEDSDEVRSSQFRGELQNFLGLTRRIQKIPRSNVNHFVGATKHPETFDICDDKYKALRSTLLRNAQITSEWIKTKLVNHPDVTTGGKDHFLQIIQEWKNDPCVKKEIKDRV